MDITIRPPENNAEMENWSEFVSRHPDGNIFQSPEMFDLWSKTAQFEPVCRLAFNQDNRITGVAVAVIIQEKGWIKRHFSSRAVIYGGPLIAAEPGQRMTVFMELMKSMIGQVGTRSVFLQIRNFFDTSEFKEALHTLGFRYSQRLNLIVPAFSEEMVLRGMSKSRHRQIQKSKKNGAVLAAPCHSGEVEIFYEILQRLYRDQVKKPLPDISFFKAFYEKSKDESFGIFRVVKYGEKIVGGIVCPITPGKTIFELYVCGLDKEYEKSGIYPSVMATWAPIEFALHHGIPSFDFMGVGVPHRSYGVRDFKMRFGGNVVNFGRYARVNNQLIYLISEVGYNLLVALRRV